MHEKHVKDTEASINKLFVVLATNQIFILKLYAAASFCVVLLQHLVLSLVYKSLRIASTWLGTCILRCTDTACSPYRWNDRKF